MNTDVVVKKYFDVPSGKIKDHAGKEWVCNKLKCQCKYREGGHNFGTGQIDKRGYYMDVSPVTVRDIDGEGLISESMAGFSGFYMLLVECGRRGEGAAKKAAAMFNEKLILSVDRYYPGNGVDFGSDFKEPLWTFRKNEGGAYLIYKGVEVAHVPEIYSSDAESRGIPLGGMARARWLCDMLERVNAVS
jgi:hypothetical protein